MINLIASVTFWLALLRQQRQTRFASQRGRPALTCTLDVKVLAHEANSCARM